MIDVEMVIVSADYQQHSLAGKFTVLVRVLY